jgi:hypothetical protein
MGAMLFHSMRRKHRGHGPLLQTRRAVAVTPYRD